MPEAPDIPTAWRQLLERTPGTRQGNPLVVEAAYAQPKLRGLYPWPSHGTLKFLRSGPPWEVDLGAPPLVTFDDLPFIVCDEPPYQVYTTGYTDLLGEASTAEEAVAIVVSHLPADTAISDD